MRGVDPKKISVTEVNPDIVQYNRLTKDKITTKDEVNPDLINFDWKIPKEYLDIDVRQHVLVAAKSRLKNQTDEYKKRIEHELNEYETRDLFNVLRVLIYVVDKFKENKVVWGVGRGSSCASLILFLLEVHSVDPIKYEIPLEEFFKADK